MKTTIDIPDDMLMELIDNTHADTKKQAILTAIEDYNRRKRMATVDDIIGTFAQFMDEGELDTLRSSDWTS